MTKQDRQKLGILIVLLVILGVTIAFGYRSNQPPAASVVPKPDARTSTAPAPANDARIRLDLVDNPEPADVGSRNLFQYRQTPAPLPPPPRGRPSPNPVTPLPTPVGGSGSIAQMPPIPPQPPPIALKYQGFAVTATPGPTLTAFLADDSRHYNVTAGEILMGRYRIVSITDKSVEVEDMQYNRRQVLPLLQ